MTANKSIPTFGLLRIVLIIFPLFCLWIHAAGAAPSLSIANTISTTGYQTGSPGASSNLKIVITNTGDSLLNSVILTDLMPNGITFTGATPTPSGNILNENGSTTITWNIGTMNPGDSKTIYPRCTRNGKVFGLVVNNAVVTGKDQAGRTVLSSKAYSVTVLKPNVRTVEVASPSSGAPCTDVTFVFNIFNTGNDTFNSVSISDLLPKGIYYNSEGTTPQPNSVNNYINGTTNLTWSNLGYFGIGSSRTITVNARITGEVCGQLMDGLKVVAKPPRDFAYNVANTTSTKIQVLKSAVELSGAVSPSSGSSGMIADFAINISNTGEVPLRLELTDTIPEGLTFISSNPAGSELGRTIKWNSLGNLAPGSSIPVRLSAKIDGQKYGTLINRAAVTGWPSEGCNVTDEDSEELAAYRSGLQINETPIPESGAPGSSIDFTIDITNTGDVNLNVINLEDLLPNGLKYSSASVEPTEKKIEENGTTSILWDNILGAPLAPNASTSIHLATTLDGSHSGSLQNKISAKGFTPAGFNVTAEDRKIVTALTSAIHVTETATPDSGGPGTLVDFRIDLANAGEVTLESFELVDLLPKGLKFRSASIDPAEIRVNDNGTATISWNNIQIVSLAPGTSTSIHLLAEIDGAQFGTVLNSIVAKVTPPNGFDVTAEDKLNISAYRSALAVVETPAPSSGSQGTLVDFKIDLTNTGEVPLNVVNLADLLPEGLRYSSASISPTKTRIDGNGTTSIVWDNVLAAPLCPDASTSIHLIAAIDGTHPGSLQNKIKAIGMPPTGYNVTAEDNRNISTGRSSIQLSETITPESGCPGTLVDFGIDITNTGDVNLDAVKVVDLLPDGLKYLSASVDPNKETVHNNKSTSVTWNNILTAPLAPNATATIHLNAKIGETQSGTLRNIVTATGTPQTGCNVTAEDERNITISRSAIKVSETPTPESGCPGTLVDFTIEIANTGDVNLDVVKVVDLLPRGLKYTSASIDPNKKTVHHNKSTSVTWNNILTAPLVPNASTSFQLVSKMDGMQSGSLQNTVTATGTISTGFNIIAEDEKNITACKSAIQVAAVPTPESGNLDALIDFKIDITNTGDTYLDAVKLMELLPKGLKYSSASIDPTKKRSNHNKTTSVTWNDVLTEPLAPNASKSIHFFATVDGTQSGLLPNKITATGQTSEGFNVTGENSRNITACVPAIEVAATPTPESGSPGTLIDFKIDITNTGKVNLDAVKLVDLLPEGLRFSSASVPPSLKKIDPNGFTNMTWNNVLSAPLAPNSSTSIHLDARVDGTAFGSLQNRVVAIGIPLTGFDVMGEDLKNITTYRSTIQVVEMPSPSFGSLETPVDFRIELTNTGELNLNVVRVVDLLPKGLNYTSASIDPDSNQRNTNGSRTIIWNNISNSALSPGSATSIHLKAKIDGSVFGGLENEVTAKCKPYIGDYIDGSSSVTVNALQPVLVSINATPVSGPKGSNITFDICTANPSNVNIRLISIADSLPSGLNYVSSDPVGSIVGNTVTWSNPEDLAPGGKAHVKLEATIEGSKFGELTDRVTVYGIASTGYKVVSSGSLNVNALAPMLTVSKTASKKVASPGEEITYTILIANTGEIPVKNVLVRDNFDSRIEFLSATPMPDSNGVWHFGLIEPRSSVIITLIVKVPVSEINFNADQKIAGDGFVNVANKFSTAQEQYILSNQVNVVADDFQGYANEKVTISSGPGTELRANEHGSGSYSSKAILQLHSKNRSVEVEKILSARSKSTTFALPGNRLEHFKSKWSDRTSGKNQISGTSAEESYRYADKIEHNSKFKLDRNGTDIAIRADFKGDAHLGFLRKSGTADTEHHTGNTTFESTEHYAGRFRIFQDVNEYGEDVRMNKSANGTGFVDVDKHIRQSQRTYESGSGDYRIEELIDTPTSYMAKKIDLKCLPVRNVYMSGLNITGSAGWKEGMSSKIKDTGYIKEEFEDIQRLKKATTARGLNQMETEANFSGRARFGALSGDYMKLDQENDGDYSIKRNLLLKGVSRFDRPHVLVTKVGHTKTERINDVNATVAEYRITVHNDGNTSLDPVRITDLFPPGMKFINSSIMPTKIDSWRANWTLMNLGTGSSIAIDLWLKAEPDSDLVNRVNVAGGYGDKWVTASNVSVIEKSWLGCCPPEIYLKETTRIDPHKKTVVWYNITLKNRAKGTITAVIIDHIPDGMRFLNSSIVPSKLSENAVKWMIMDLKPGEERPITYKAEASRDGKFIDLVHVDASLVHGQGAVSAEASAQVVVGPTLGKAGKRMTDSSSTEVIRPNEPPSDYNWNQEPLAECSGPCPAFSESSEGEIP